jgi:hypothetical protein
LVGGRTGLKLEEVGRGRRELRNEEFGELCVGEGDGVMEGEMDGSVTYIGVERI